MSDPRLLTDDVEHLRLLAIFHYVVGGLACFFALIPLIYTLIGSIFVVASRSGAMKPGQQAPPEVVGWIFIFFGIVLCLFGLAVGLAIVWSGRSIARRRHYWFSFVMACIECLFLPFGTILGVFTLIVLSRESVKVLFHPGAGGSVPASGA